MVIAPPLVALPPPLSLSLSPHAAKPPAQAADAAATTRVFRQLLIRSLLLGSCSPTLPPESTPTADVKEFLSAQAEAREVQPDRGLETQAVGRVQALGQQHAGGGHPEGRDQRVLHHLAVQRPPAWALAALLLG